jgi:two-component system phosphate regulon sensor histidine kinase PhoR
MEISDLGSRKDTSRVLTIDEISYLLNSVLIAQTPFELYKLDSIYSAILKEKEIESKYDIIIFEHKLNSILEQSNITGNVHYQFHTGRKELDSERDVQINFKNPVSLILKEMALSFIFSFIMLVVIVIALIYQSRIISRQKKIETIRQDFIDSMTHELRHPLQGALSLSEIIDNEKIAENNLLRSSMISRLKANLQSLEMLLQSLVVQSYTENLQTTAHWQQGNLKSYIDEIIATCSISNTKLVHFKTCYSEEITNCRFDPMHFPNAIKNLIENAIKYSNDEVTVDIRAVIKNETIEIMVADSGTGITKEDLPHIFEKFYKGNSSKKSHGFGLGLSYVKWVCDIHDGQVTVTSTVDKGSIFKLIIPNFITNEQSKNTDCRE